MVLLARFIQKRGVPQSTRHVEHRSRQRRQIGGLIYAEVARMIIGRLKKYSKKSGVEDIDVVGRPVTEAEENAVRNSVRRGDSEDSDAKVASLLNRHR